MLTLLYAAPFATQNQATYLLEPLARAMPDLFARDWLVREAPSYMPVFGWLAQWLFVVDPEGPIAFLTAHVIITFATYAALWAVVSAVGGGARAFAIVAALVTVTRGVSMGGSYLLAGYLQPSSLATLGWVVALAAFVRARYLACGVAAACAGLVHANFLVLGVGLFTLAAVACRDVSWRDHARLLVPQLVVLACFVPMLAQSAGASANALQILSEVHAPGHYAPRRLGWWITGVLCWQIAGFGAMFVLRDDKAARALWRFSLVASGLACTTALLVQLAPLRFLVQLFVPRVAPFAQLACIALVGAALARLAFAPPPLTRLQRATLSLGLVVALATYGAHVRGLLPWPALLVACVMMIAAVALPRVARHAVVLLAIAGVAYAAATPPANRALTTRPAGAIHDRELYAWARTRTDVDALFLVPPGLGAFRLLARRAVVVDTKSPPLRPDWLEHWYARLCAATLAEPGPSARELAARYDGLASEQLREVARAFDADFVVVDRDAAFDADPVFANARWAAYRVRAER